MFYICKVNQTITYYACFKTQAELSDDGHDGDVRRGIPSTDLLYLDGSVQISGCGDHRNTFVYLGD
jgi:hypothetical protein